MKRTHIFPVLLAVLAVSSGLAPIYAQSEKASDPTAEIAALVAEHAESKLSYSKKLELFRPRFLAFAKAQHGTEAELTAQLWLFGQTWWQRSAGTMEESAAVILKDICERHSQSTQLDQIVEKGYVLAKDTRKKTYESLLELSPHNSVRAAAHLGLGKLGARNKSEAGDEARAHLQTLIDKYAKLSFRSTTYGAMAEALLHPHSKADLVIGKMAPEIEGVNQSGKLMRLSDYRGKVVILDFWGDW